MSGEQYSVVFSGELHHGASLPGVKTQLAEKFNLKPNQVERLFSAQHIRVRKCVGLDEARKFKSAFESTGAVCRLLKEQPSKNTTATKKPPTKNQSEAAVKAAPKPAADITPEFLANQFKGNIVSIRPGLRYRAGLVATAVAILLLPLVYLALITGIGWATGWHALHNVQWLSSGNLLFKLFGYVTLLIMGLTACLFLLKPLFFSGRTHYNELELKPQKEPLLFEFVNQIADLVNAPRPETIVVNMQVNAAASYYEMSGKSKRATLFLGMPLFAGFDTRQLAGVLAHEFGHFSQGWGMRATYLIRVINYWFYRAVYERDALDHKLEKLTHSEHDWLQIPFGFAKMAVEAQRGLLARLLWLAEAISRHMLREMEFDADRYEVQLAGSDHFRETSYRMRLLNHTFNAVMSDLSEMWEERRLVDDLPALIVKNAKEYDKDWRAEIEREMQESTTTIFDSHPGDIQRIQRAEAARAEGIFHLKLPARHLLKEYDRLVKLATIRFYRGDLGLSIEENQLVSAERASTSIEQLNKRTETLEDYFREFFTPWHCMQLASLGDFKPLPEAERKQRLQELVNELRHAMPDIRIMQQKYTKLWEDMPEAHLQLVTSQANIPWPYDEPWRGPGISELKTAEAEITNHHMDCESTMAERLIHGLQGHIEQQADKKKTQQLITYLLDFQDSLHSLQEAWHQLFLEKSTLNRLIGIRQWAEENKAKNFVISEQVIDNRMRYLRVHLTKVERQLEQAIYPFLRPDGWVPAIKHFEEIIPEPTGDTVADILARANVIVENLPDLHRKVMGMLAMMATRYETKLGIEPIRITLAKK